MEKNLLPHYYQHHLFHKPHPIDQILIAVAAQENCDGPDHDLMQAAGLYIRKLEHALMLAQDKIDDLKYEIRRINE